MGYATHPVHSMKEIEKLIPKMAQAEKRRVHVEGMNNLMPLPQFDREGLTGFIIPEGYWTDEVNAIVNAKSGEFVQVVTPSYTILQHGKFYRIVVEALRDEGYTEVDGVLTEQNDGSNMSLKIIFKGHYIEEPGLGNNIGVGGSFGNSFDSTRAARGCAHFLRISCTNQMTLKTVIPEAVFARNHMAADEDSLEEGVTEGVTYFVKNLEAAGVRFKTVMTEAMTDDIKLDSSDQLFDLMMSIFKVRSHAEAITEEAWKAVIRPYRGAKHYTVDRWELYGAACAYASRTDLSPQVEELIMYRAESKLLSQPITMPANGTQYRRQPKDASV